jgi:hypothetical protein
MRVIGWIDRRRLEEDNERHVMCLGPAASLMEIEEVLA